MIQIHLRIILCTILISPVTNVGAATLPSNETCSKNTCIAVFDAGSTGTRLHIFSYSKDKKNHTRIKQIFSKKIKPSISGLSLNHERVSEYMCHFSKKDHGRDIPTYFFATAGMRFIPKERQDRHYRPIKNWFNQQQQFDLKEIKTISGKQEGIFGWLSVYAHINHGKTKRNDSFGFMDWGGASIQVTLPVRHPQGIDNANRFNIHLDGKTITLFSDSFLGLGGTTIPAFMAYLITALLHKRVRC